MSIRFKCNKCGMGIKAPDKCAGRTAKCPNCKNPIVVSAIRREQMPSWINGDSEGCSTNLYKAQLPTKYKSKRQIKMCPLCNKEIPAIATMCKSCDIAFGHEIAEAKRPTERVSIKLRQQYRCLEYVREDELRSTLHSSIPGIVLYALGWWLIIAVPFLSFFIWIISYLFLVYSCVSYAIYKGRSIAWGLILGFTIWPLMIFLHDVNKDRMNEIETRLEALYVPSV
jgi:hypothetical protein